MIPLPEKFPSQMDRSSHLTKAFTLSEVLLVLLLWSILLLCILPLNQKTFHHIQTNYYLNQMKEDLLLAQQLSMQDHPFYFFKIRPSTNDYLLSDGLNKKTLFHREFPDNWRLQMLTLENTIRFNPNGTINHPGTMKIHTPNQSFKITFPFGTSRIRIEEQ